MVLCSLVLLAATASGQTKPASPIVAGYLPTWRLGRSSYKDFAGLSDVIVFSAVPMSTGELDTSAIDPEKLAVLQEQKAAYGYRTLLTIGGWGRSGEFATVCKTATTRSKFIAGIKRYLTENDFDGVDYNWENPTTTQDQQAYTKLIIETDTAFKKTKLRLTAKVAPFINLPKSAWSALDAIHVMSYDHPGAHSTQPDAERDLDLLASKGAPKERLVLGIPFYGRNLLDASKTMSYAEIFKQFRPDKGSDEAGDYSFNGIDTVKKKAGLVKLTGIGGVMIWELGQDAPGTDSLLKAILTIVKVKR